VFGWYTRNRMHNPKVKKRQVGGQCPGFAAIFHVLGGVGIA
jgi:hypothetical protein